MSEDRPFIPYGRQSISEADIEAVVSVLKSDFLTQGPIVPAFEKAIAGRCQAAHAVAVNSATSALHLACLALGVTEGDMVWTVPTTFVASANCARYCGAEVDFVDIDSKTWCMCPQKLEDKLKGISANGGKMPKVVIPVHLSGQSCDMRAIHGLSEKYGFSLIEDASHAIGGTYENEPVGNCKYSDVAVFSFHPVKIMTTGEGGIATTQSGSLARKMALLRTHGVTRDPELMVSPNNKPWYYEQVDLGFNYRMTDIQAALGVSQLERLSEFVEKRNSLAASYERLLGEMAQTQFVPDNVYSARHLYPVRIPEADHLRVHVQMREAHIGVNLHYMPVHLQPYYRCLGFKEGDFPESEQYAREAVSLPLFPLLSEVLLQHVVKELKRTSSIIF